MPLERHKSTHGRNDEVTTWDSDDLPESLQEMSDVIGLEAVRTFVSVYGGTRLTVPQKMPDDHPLAELLGIKTACKLSEHYAQERLDVPRADAASKRARNRRMRAEHRAGESVRQLAFRYRLTERRIWEILAEESPDAPK